METPPLNGAQVDLTASIVVAPVLFRIEPGFELPVTGRAVYTIIPIIRQFAVYRGIRCNAANVVAECIHSAGLWYASKGSDTGNTDNAPIAVKQGAARKYLACNKADRKLCSPVAAGRTYLFRLDLLGRRHFFGVAAGMMKTYKFLGSGLRQGILGELFHPARFTPQLSGIADLASISRKSPFYI